MIKVVPRHASDESVLNIVKGWVDVLAKQNYRAVFENLGHSVSFGERFEEPLVGLAPVFLPQGRIG